MQKRYIVAIIGAIATIVTAIIQKPNKQMAESPQLHQVSGTGDKNGIGVGTIHGGTVGIGSVGGAGVNYGPITNIFPSSPQQVQSNSSKENQGSPPPKQQYHPDTGQLTAHAQATVEFSLKGNITLANGTKEPFDGLQTISERGPIFLDVYPRESSDKKTIQIDLKEVASVTFGKSVDAPDGMFFEIGIQFRKDRYEKTFVGREDKLITAIADKRMDIEFYKIKKIEFN